MQYRYNAYLPPNVIWYHFSAHLQQCDDFFWTQSLELEGFHSTSKGIIGECGQRGGYMEYVGVDQLFGGSDRVWEPWWGLKISKKIAFGVSSAFVLHLNAAVPQHKAMHRLSLRNKSCYCNGYFKDWLHLVALHSSLGSNTGLFLSNMTQQHAWHVCVLMLPWWVSWRLGVTPFLLMQKRWCLAFFIHSTGLFLTNPNPERCKALGTGIPQFLLYPPIGLLHPGHTPRRAAGIDWIWLLRERLETSLLGTARVFCYVIPNEIRIKNIYSAPPPGPTFDEYIWPPSFSKSLLICFNISYLYLFNSTPPFSSQNSFSFRPNRSF